MISWYWHRLLQAIGYRQFWYFPSAVGVDIDNFFKWEYRPDLPKGAYRA